MYNTSDFFHALAVKKELTFFFFKLYDLKYFDCKNSRKLHIVYNITLYVFVPLEFFIT